MTMRADTVIHITGEASKDIVTPEVVAIIIQNWLKQILNLLSFLVIISSNCSKSEYESWTYVQINASSNFSFSI
uniref:Putative ovule protein n=1 Tax=Solanum chacoense TaxID=4108 RepID=A0A0V0GYS7_SOLCH